MVVQKYTLVAQVSASPVQSLKSQSRAIAYLVDQYISGQVVVLRKLRQRQAALLCERFFERRFLLLGHGGGGSAKALKRLGRRERRYVLQAITRAWIGTLELGSKKGR